MTNRQSVRREVSFPYVPAIYVATMLQHVQDAIAARGVNVECFAELALERTGMSPEEILGVDVHNHLITFNDQLLAYSNLAALANSNKVSGIALTVTKTRPYGTLGALQTGMMSSATVRDAFDFNKEYLAATGAPLLFDWYRTTDGERCVVQAVCREYYEPALLRFVTEEVFGVWCLAGLPLDGLPTVATAVRFSYRKPNYSQKYVDIVPTKAKKNLKYAAELGPNVVMEADLPNYVLDHEIPTRNDQALRIIKSGMNDTLTCIGKGRLSLSIANVLFMNTDPAQSIDVWSPEYVASVLNRRNARQLQYELSLEKPKITFSTIRGNVRKSLYRRFISGEKKLSEISWILGYRDKDSKNLRKKFSQWD